MKTLFKIFSAFFILTFVFTFSTSAEEKEIQKIEIASINKTKYLEGEKVERGDLSVDVVYTDGSRQNISDSVILPSHAFDSSSKERIVSISYHGHKTSYMITVVSLSKIEVEYTGTTAYYVGENINVSAIKVTARYSDATRKDVSEDARIIISPVKLTNLGTQAIRVEFLGRNAVFNVFVKEGTRPVTPTPATPAPAEPTPATPAPSTPEPSVPETPPTEQLVYTAPTEGTAGEIEWRVEDGVLTISGSGEMPHFSDSQLPPWFYQWENIKSVKIENGVKNIGNEAFAHLYYITSICIPATVESIGSEVFKYSNPHLSVYEGTRAHAYAIDEELDFTPVLIEKIEVSALPQKLVLDKNDTLGTQGLEITVTFADGVTAALNDGFTLSYSSELSPGENEISVEYLSHSTSFTVTVNDSPDTDTAPEAPLSEEKEDEDEDEEDDEDDEDEEKKSSESFDMSKATVILVSVLTVLTIITILVIIIVFRKNNDVF